MTAAERSWVEAGLLDPTAPGADDRRQLLTWLHGLGLSLDQMVEAHGRGRLFGLAGDVQARPERPSLTLEAAAPRAGLSPTLLAEVWRRAGFADPAPGDPVLAPREADAFAVLGAAVEFLGEDTVLRLAATVGTAVRRMAEAVIVAGIEESSDMLLDRSANELATAQTYHLAMSMVDPFLDYVDTLFRLHHEAGNRHVELGLLLGDAVGTTVRLAVGFADLSGYTSLAQTLSRAQLAELVHRFAAWAGDVVTQAGGRLVQQLGDAVMLVGSPASVAVAAVRLSAGPGEGVLPPLRAGAAFGDVVLEGGDYFGPVVNLAARLTTDAAPTETLVDPALAAALGREAWELTATPERRLKGIAEPVTAYRLSAR